MFALAACQGEEADPAPSKASRDVVRVAVASNFAATMRPLAETFAAQTGLEVESSTASTGKLYAQIRAGAPFDVFLAADAERPERLVEQGLGIAGSLRRYATGRLVVVVHRAARAARATEAAHAAKADDAQATGWLALPDCLTPLLLDTSGSAGHIALAQPRTAPYGRAARTTLERLGLLDRVRGRLVHGENVSQVMQFVDSGNAQIGFVSLAQFKAYRGNRLDACHWTVPENVHAPIVQKMVVLTRSAEREAATRFARFMETDAAASILRGAGYGL